VLYEMALTAGPLVAGLLAISSAAWLPLIVLGLAGLTGALVTTSAGSRQRTTRPDAGSSRRANRGDDPPRPPRSANRGDDPAKPRRQFRGLTLGAGVLRLVALQAFIGLALGGLAVSVPALAAQVGALNWSGLMLSAVFAGSMIGGLAYGARKWTGPARHRLMAALSLITLFLVLFRLLPWLPAKGVALLLAGVSVAPGLTVVLSLVPRLAHRGRTAEAFSWLSFAEPAGAGAGSWLAGLAASAHLLPLALWLPAAGAAASLAISALPWNAIRQPGNAGAERSADAAG
jgi:hypothetical protein